MIVNSYCIRVFFFAWYLIDHQMTLDVEVNFLYIDRYDMLCLHIPYRFECNKILFYTQIQSKTGLSNSYDNVRTTKHNWDTH